MLKGAIWGSSKCIGYEGQYFQASEMSPLRLGNIVAREAGMKGNHNGLWPWAPILLGTLPLLPIGPSLSVL